MKKLFLLMGNFDFRRAAKKTFLRFFLLKFSPPQILVGQIDFAEQQVNAEESEFRHSLPSPYQQILILTQ